MKTLILLLLFSFTVSAQYVLEFDGTKQQHVDHGVFFDILHVEDKAAGFLDNDFAWEAWIKINPVSTGGYVISFGYGGAHGLLFGAAGPVGGPYGLTGNFTIESVEGLCNGFENVSFGSPATMTANTWYHIAFASYNHIARMYINGQVVATQTWVGQRISSSCSVVDTSAYDLYVGGSNHINFTGRIGSIRGWEGFSPYRETNFTPEISFRGDWYRAEFEYVSASFLADYTQRATVIADLSNGYRSKKHPGHLQSAQFGLWAGHAMPTAIPLPKFVEDPTYPAFGN